MDISIICPVYNGEKYIEDLHKNILSQKINANVDIKYILTQSSDNSENILKKLNAEYTLIQPKEYSHSLSREKEAFLAKGDIIVFISQDVIMVDDKWLINLTKDIMDNKCEAAFSKQICTNKSIERYTRMKNYPDDSRIVSKDDEKKYGIMTYFFSDASSAIKKEVFIKLKGYDNKDLLTNEDMYFAYKLINNGYRIKYCSDSKVIHSHKYSFNTLVKRYFDQGVFLEDNNYIRNVGANKGAINLLKFVLKQAIKEKNFGAIFNVIPNFGARFIGNKLGKNYRNMSKRKILKYTANKNYWERKNN